MMRSVEILKCDKNDTTEATDTQCQP